MIGATQQSTSIERFGGVFGILTGVLALLYSLAFVVISPGDADLGAMLTALFLMLGGVVTMPVLIAVYNRLQRTDLAVALWALMLGIAGAFGATIHGGYDLANAVNPPGAVLADLAELPSQLDPRALLTFGLAGAGMLVVSWLIVRGGQLPRGLGYLGYLLGVLLVVLYLGRLVILDPQSLVIVGPALLAGFIVSPAWYIWLGLTLWRSQHANRIQTEMATV